MDEVTSRHFLVNGAGRGTHRAHHLLCCVQRVFDMACLYIIYILSRLLRWPVFLVLLVVCCIGHLRFTLLPVALARLQFTVACCAGQASVHFVACCAGQSSVHLLCCLSHWPFCSSYTLVLLHWPIFSPLCSLCCLLCWPVQFTCSVVCRTGQSSVHILYCLVALAHLQPTY